MLLSELYKIISSFIDLGHLQVENIYMEFLFLREKLG